MGMGLNGNENDFMGVGEIGNFVTVRVVHTRILPVINK